MEKPIISLVVPVYKVPEMLLRRCLDSLAAQTSENFEAILIDDGSPDGCGAILDAFGAEHPFARVIHQENRGLSLVRNRGIEEARGEWVGFVDGDDWIEPETVAFAEDYIRECPDGDVLIWDEYYQVDGVRKPNVFIKGHQDGRIYAFEGEQKLLIFDMFFPAVYRRFEGNYVDIGTANARLYKRDFLISHDLRNIPGLKRMQDNVFNLWVTEKAGKIYYQCKRLYHYTFNPHAATQRYSPDMADTMELLYRCMKDFVAENRNQRDFYQRLYCRFVRIWGEIFKLNYANPANPLPFRARVQMVRRDMAERELGEAVSRIDPAGHSRKTRLLIWLMRRRCYGLLIVYYSLSIRTRRVRLMTLK